MHLTINTPQSAIFLSVTTCHTLDLDSPTFYLLVTVFIASVIILPLVAVTLFIYINIS